MDSKRAALLPSHKKEIVHFFCLVFFAHYLPDYWESFTNVLLLVESSAEEEMSPSFWIVLQDQASLSLSGCGGAVGKVSLVLLCCSPLWGWHSPPGTFSIDSLRLEQRRAEAQLSRYRQVCLSLDLLSVRNWDCVWQKEEESCFCTPHLSTAQRSCSPESVSAIAIKLSVLPFVFQLVL